MPEGGTGRAGMINERRRAVETEAVGLKLWGEVN
jgi:hypothetical protein